MKAIGKTIITLVALWAAFGSYIFDMSPSHMFNQLWPPHAKYHNAQTMLLGTAIGLLSIWVLWFRDGNKVGNLQLAVILASVYWLTQLGSFIFPGTALFDPEFAPPGNLPVQLIMDGALLVLLGAYTVAYKNIED